MTKFLEKIIKFSLYSLVFLLPLFWLPFSFEAYEFSKQYLLFFLVSISLLAWLSKMIFIDKEIRFRKTPLDALVLIFLSVAVISAIFSVDKNSSLFGFYGRFSNSLIGLLCLGAFYFLITNSSNFKLQISNLIKPFLWSVFFVVLISYFSIFGIWQKISTAFPLLILQRTFNPTSGSLEGLAVFLSTVAVLLVSLILCLKPESRQKIHWVLLIAIFGLLAVINFNSAWIILIASLGLFLIFALITRIFKENVNWLLLPIFLIIFSTIFLFLDDTSQLTGIGLPKEQVLEQGISWNVALGAVTENLKNGFLGSGIGTWHYDFSKFKPIEFNAKLWWQIRFDRSGSHISEIFGTLGFLGVLSYLALIGTFFLVSWFLRKNLEFLPYAITFLALLIGQFVYYQNTVLAFTFWFILGLGVVSWQKPIIEKTFSFKDFPELSLVFSALLIFFCLGILTSCYFGVRFYLADMNYAKAQQTPLVEERTKILENAVALNPKLATYRIILARVYLAQIIDEVGKPLVDQDATKIQNLMARAIDQVKKTTEISPNRVAVWETSGMIYRDIQPFVTGATEWAIKSFQEALELESKNPVLHTELGKLYLGLGDIEKAKESFTKAKELKSDYIDALIQDVLIYERENDLDAAIEKMEELVRNYPLNIEIKFQLGRLYFNQNRIEEAIFQFEEVITIMPNHSNTLYSLGVAYTKKDEKEKAIAVFERVLELNPGNEDVILKIEELKK